MYWLFMSAVMGAMPNELTAKTTEAVICVSIIANDYTYTVTNRSPLPIDRFEMNQHAGYNFHAPKGWLTDTAHGKFKAWTADPALRIPPNGTAVFSLRVSSTGAVLALSPIEIGSNGKLITVPNVWTPSPEPRSYPLLIAGILIGIFLWHTFVLNYRDRHQRGTSE